MEHLLSEAEKLAHIGSWELDLRTLVMGWSPGMHTIHGYDEGTVTPTFDLILENAHPDDREPLSDLLGQVLADPDAFRETGVESEYRTRRPDGSYRDLLFRAQLELDDEGRPERLLGVAQDMTDRRLTERELQARYAVTQALRDWESFEEGLVTLVRRLGTALDFPLGGLWVWDEESKRLVPRASWSAPTVDAEAFELAVRSVSVRPGQGITGAAWESGEPTLVSDDPSRFRSQEAGEMGVRAGLALPVIGEGGPFAVLSYYDTEPHAAGETLMGTFIGIGRELGLFLSRRRAELGPQRLSERELEVLQLAAEGHSGPQIAERLFVSPTTVKTHFEHIYDKLGVGDRAAAVAHALRTGLIH
jgi:PAS domain S-box-containing protein